MTLRTNWVNGQKVWAADMNAVGNDVNDLLLRVARIEAAGGAGGAGTWAAITNKPDTFPPSAHTHVTADITDLASVLSGYATSSALTAKADKTYVDSQDSGKVDKVSSVNRVYATDNAGAQISVALSQSATGGSVAQRATDGTLTTATPTLAGHAATKAYVDKIGAVDVSKYLVSGNVFDVNAVIAAMEAGGGACYIPPGDWTPNAVNVGLNETTVPATGTQQSRFRYRFFGAGAQSRIILPASMANSDYLFIANSSGALTTFAAHPKVVFEDIAVSGASGTNGNFFRSYQRSFSARRVYFSNVRNGFYHTGYSDLCRIEQVYAESMISGGWVFTGINNGDGLVIDQLFAYACAGINLKGCAGASIRGCISGWHQFQSCNVTFDECHFEGDGTTSSTPTVTLIGCVADVMSGYYQTKTYRNTFSISDVGGTLMSKVTFREACRFVQRVDDPGSTLGALRGTDVDIADLGRQSEVVFYSPRTQLLPQSTALGGAAGNVNVLLSPTVTASGVAAIQTILTQRPLVVGQDTVIRYSGGGWEAVPTRPNDYLIPTKAVPTAFLSGTAQSNATGGYTTTLAAGTYYYKLWGRDPVTRATLSSSEVAVTVTAGSPVPALVFNIGDAPMAMRLLRGTTSGSYSQYAQVLIGEATGTLYDQGSHIGGTAWSAWSGTPAASTTNETRNGKYHIPTQQSVIYASAAPTSGNWLVGDFCWNTGAGVAGWRCTTAGYPGTWTAIVDQSYVDTKAPKPTGTPDGTKYYRDDGTWAVPAGSGGGGTPAWADITGKPSTFPPSAHTHATSEITGLDTTLGNKANDTAVVHKAGVETITGGKTFSAYTQFGDAGVSGLLYTKNVYVEPQGGAGNTAVITMDNDNGQIWQHTNNSGGTYGFYDQTNAKSPLLILPNSPQDALKISAGTNSMAQALSMLTNKITNLGTPTATTDAATKAYVDGKVSATPYHANVGTGAAGPYTVTHNLNTWDVCPVVSRNAGHANNIGLANPGEIIRVQVVPISVNAVQIIPDETWATNQFHVAIYPLLGGDIVAPTGGVLNEGAKDANNITVTIASATDAGDGITFFEWDLNGTFQARTPVATTAYTYSGLSSSTAYTLGCTVVDLRGNRTRFTRSSSTTATAAVLFASQGAGAKSDTNVNSVSWAHTVAAGGNRAMVVAIEASHLGAAWDWPNSYSVKNVTSSLGDTFLRIDGTNYGQGIGPGGQTTGGVLLFYCLNPTVGTHTLTANVTSSGNNQAIKANSYVYTGVGSVANTTYTGENGSNRAGSLAIPSNASGDMSVFFFGASDTITVGAGPTARSFPAGASIGGNGDYGWFGELAGTGTVTVTTSSTAHIITGMGFRLVKAA